MARSHLEQLAIRGKKLPPRARPPGDGPPSHWLASPKAKLRGPMRGVRIRPPASDVGGSAGRAQASARAAVRRIDARWGWTHGSHFGRELADWVVVRIRPRWR